jgi:hypothetical protein
MRTRCKGALVVTMLAAIACKEPAPHDQRPEPTPMQDPTWPAAREAAVALDSPAGATAVVLPLSVSPTQASETQAQLLKTLRPHPLEALSAVIALPEPCTATASGVGPSEAWTFERRIAGASYSLQVRLDRRHVADLAQLQATASELGGSEVIEKGQEKSGLLWLQKRAIGPVQELWVARPLGPAALVAVCTAPPEYRELARRVCLSLAPWERLPGLP